MADDVRTDKASRSCRVGSKDRQKRHQCPSVDCPLTDDDGRSTDRLGYTVNYWRSPIISCPQMDTSGPWTELVLGGRVQEGLQKARSACGRSHRSDGRVTRYTGSPWGGRKKESRLYWYVASCDKG